MKAEHSLPYQEALDWLHELLRFGQKPGLERMQWLLAELGHPERCLAFVHVAGTNGKGSTCALLTETLLAAGYSVGTFTSPYLTDFRERIRYKNEMIPKHVLCELVNHLKPLAERCERETEYGSPTEFEVVTLLAICYFANHTHPAVVVWETGLGGRLDSTNVVCPLVSVITNVGLDHTDVLGNSLEEIAFEKAGIIKPGVPVIVGDVTEEVMGVISETAKRQQSTVYRFGQAFFATSLGINRGLSTLTQSLRYRSIFRRHEVAYALGLIGEHQVQNAALALMVTDVLGELFAYHFEPADVERGMLNARWPGRMESVSQQPLVILDGAHNTEGMKALVASLRHLIPSGSRVHLLVSALADKPLSEMASVWQDGSVPIEQIHLTSFDFSRAASIDALHDAFDASGFNSNQLVTHPDWSAFLREWMRDESRANDVLVICGSLYFIAQVRAFFPIPVEEAGE